MKAITSNSSVLTLWILLFVTGCSEGCGPSEALPEMEAFNEAQQGVHRSMNDYAGRLVGEGGFVERAAILRDLDFSRPEDVQQWVEQSKMMDEELEALLVILADGALKALESSRMRSEILGMREQGFTAEALELRQRAFILKTMALATAGITIYRTFRSIGETVDDSQKIVTDMARGEPASREAVADALRKNGVSVPDGSSGEDLAGIFEEQGRNTRRRVANDVREQAGQLIMDGGAEGDEPTDLAVEDSERRVDSAVQLGEIAVDSCVAASQSVTGGAGDLIGGTAGAATDLVLTATENDPMSQVKRHVDVVVVSKDTQPVEQPPPSEIPVEDAAAIMEQTAQGEDGPGPEILIDAANALWTELLELGSQLGALASLPSRIAFTEATLEEEHQGEEATTYSAVAPVPGFSEGERAEILATRTDITPQEVPTHELGPDSPLVLDSPPLLGTLSVRSSPAGLALGESQLFDVTVTMRDVPSPTSLTCTGTNAVVSQSVLPAPSAGEYNFRVEVFGRASMRIRRSDSGESYLFTLRMEAPEEPEFGGQESPECIEAKLHLCMNLPRTGCDISIMKRAQERVMAACGYWEAIRFLDEAPNRCC